MSKKQKSDGNPQLTAIVVVGRCRDRSQRCLDALSVQTAVDSLEILVADLSSSGTPRLRTSDQASVVYLSQPDDQLWSRARYEAVMKATAPVIAFIEDHCYPEPDWAAALIAAHRGPWAAVGYAFKNANPETYMARACMLNDYGMWLYPTSNGERQVLPGQNISYKRDLLCKFGERLELLLTPDFNLQQVLIKQGWAMYVEGRAVVAHENFNSLAKLMRAHHAYARLLAGHRTSTDAWSVVKRILYGVAVLPGAPVITAYRLIRSMGAGGPQWFEVVVSLPVYTVTRLWAAVGESLGTLAGAGKAAAILHDLEIDSERGGGK